MIEKPELDHIGIAVDSIASGLAIYRSLGIEVEGVEEVASIWEVKQTAGGFSGRR